MAEEVKSLTGLRWFAALAVFLYHYGNPAWIPNRLWRIEHNGLLGVQFFFVLSGYVLTLRYFKIRFQLRRYLLSRVARIWPMYLAGLFLSFVYLVYSNQPTPLRLVAVHAVGLQAWNPEMDFALGLNGPAWTVSVEFFFYLMFPILLTVFRRWEPRTKLGPLLMLAGTALGGLLTVRQVVAFGPVDTSLQELPNSFIWFRLVPIHYLGLFVTGIGAAITVLNSQSKGLAAQLGRFVKPEMIVGLLILSITCVSFNTPTSSQLALSARFWLTGPPFAILLMSLHLHPRNLVSKILGSDLISFLGKISYSFYILHVPFISLLRLKLPNLSYEIRFMLLLLCSTLAYLTIEQPLRKFLTRLPD